MRAGRAAEHAGRGHRSRQARAGHQWGLEEDERDIIEFVRQLLQNNKVEQDLFDALQGRKGVRWLVELAATVGQYQYISAINTAFGVVAAPDADQLPV